MCVASVSGNNDKHAYSITDSNRWTYSRTKRTRFRGWRAQQGALSTRRVRVCAATMISEVVVKRARAVSDRDFAGVLVADDLRIEVHTVECLSGQVTVDVGAAGRP